MSDNATGTGTPATPPATPPTPPVAPAPETPRTNEEWAAALARTNNESAQRRIALKAAEEKAQAAEAELTKLKAEKAAAEAEKLKAQGEWQKVAEGETAKAAELSAKLTAAQAKADKFEAQLKARETALMDKIPEAVRGKLKLESMSLEDRVSTLETVAEMANPAAPNPAAPNTASPPAPRVAPAPASPAVKRADAVKAIQNDRSLTPAEKARKLHALPKE